ncbi:MAG: hypothetical protein CMJ18_00420 [Phycisphaeraceae bacterium]|nr:hypothetical protein [Phycisphaeraceae bacterium]
MSQSQGQCDEQVMVEIREVRRCKIASGERRHRAFTGALRLADGDMLVFYREATDHWATDDGGVMMVRSTDDGRTWSAPRRIFSRSRWSSAAHHGPAQLSDGRILLPLTLIRHFPKEHERERELQIHLIVSADGGRSWSRSVRLGPMEGWRWQNNYGRVRETSDGRILVPGGGQKIGEEPWYSGYFVSDDGGLTFPGRVDVAQGLADEIDMTPLPDGRWIAMVRDEKEPYHLHQACSQDEGCTWSTPVPSSILGHCPSFLALRSGTILLGHRQVDTARPYGCTLSASKDGGATWMHVSDIYVSPLKEWDSSYPSMVQLEDGRVFCSYYGQYQDGNSDIEGITFEVAE